MNSKLVWSRYWRAVAWLMCLAVFLAAVIPGSTGVMRFPMMDKLQHLMSFLALTVWFAGAYERHHYIRLAVGLLILGLLIEIAQGQLSHRTADPYDFIADALGIGLGLALALAGFGRWCFWVESMLGVRPRA